VTFRLDVEPYRAQLASTVGNQRQRHALREGAIVRLSIGDVTGLGEAAPLPGYSDETFERSLAELRSFDPLALPPFGAAARNAGLLNALEQVLSALAPSARFALETAYLDAHARASSLPLHRLLQRLWGTAESDAGVRAQLSALVNDRADAERALNAGFRCLKLKVGATTGFERELQELQAVRALSADVTLRLDANQAFGAEQTPPRLRRLAAYGLEFIEEPCPQAWSVGPLPVPLALDESLRQPELPALEELASRVAAVVLKPTTLGGFARCFELARRAETAGIARVVSHTFEGVIAHAACCELALALGAQARAHGLAPHAALNAWNEVSPRLRAAELVAGDAPGLGLSHVERRVNAPC